MADTFTDGEYRTVVTNEDIELYRVYGGDAKREGAFWTTEPAESQAGARQGRALLDEWGNTKKWEERMVVPKGTKLNIGTVERQIEPTGEVLFGGDDQILVPKDYDSSWRDPSYRRRLK